MRDIEDFIKTLPLEQQTAIKKRSAELINEVETLQQMRKARALLGETSMGVKAIAAKVGYSNESAFSNAFKRATGLSPGSYRRSKSDTSSR